ncbi:MAG: hypothetical protein LBB88_04285 [Planctomycetaceae bacterium]|nr:hypothetical protein [Planctomycetaceae bacterium]
MRKLFTLVIVALASFAIAGCSSETTKPKTTTTAPTTTTTPAPEKTDTPPTTDGAKAPDAK